MLVMRNHRLKILLALILFSISESAQAVDLVKQEKLKFRKIIQEELMYPRPCKLRLPFQITKTAEEKSQYQLDLVDSLKENEILTVRQDKGKYNLYPGPNTIDVVQAHVNLAYEITYINLHLGTYNIKITGFEHQDGLVRVRGYRYVKGKTRIFQQVINNLPEEVAKSYLKTAKIWTLIPNKNNSYNVEEISSSD